MNTNVKSVLSAVTDSLETAAGYALIAVGIYVAVFVDVTGRGSLWNTLHNLQDLTQDEGGNPSSTRVIKVSASPGTQKVHEDRILAVFDEPVRRGPVAAVYQPPETVSALPAGKLSAAATGREKSSKRDIKGGLRTFTVYGNGEQTSSASASSRKGAQAPKPAADVPVAAEGSAARAGTAAMARPGIGSRLSRGLVSGSDASRNVR